MQTAENTASPLQFYSPTDIATVCGVSCDTVYRYHREVRARKLSQPFPDRFPFEKPDALRFIEYVQKRLRKTSRNADATRMQQP